MPEDPGYRIVDTDEQLDEVVDQLLDTDRYAIDTEFHRERTYYPQLALIQIAWPGDLVLIDPIAVDPEPLAEVFRSTDVEAVLHACSQDLEVLELVAGAAPSRIFDTQIAAAFVGMRTPSLASLHDQLLGLKLPKASTQSQHGRATDGNVNIRGVALDGIGQQGVDQSHHRLDHQFHCSH